MKWKNPIRQDEREYLSGGTIVPSGTMDLGLSLELCRELEQGERIEQPVVDQDDVDRSEFVPGLLSPRPMSNEKVTETDYHYVLKDQKANFAICDKGLAQAYLLFGAPGMGKSHLLLYMLKQVLSFNRDSPSHKTGLLIIDPKNSLKPVNDVVKNAGRWDDFIRIDSEYIRQTQSNILKVDASPNEIGYCLLLAAKAAGMELSDNYWQMAAENLLGGIIGMLQATMPSEINIKTLIETAIGSQGRYLKDLIELAEMTADRLDRDKANDLRIYIDRVKNSVSEEKTFSTVANAIGNVYNVFLQSANRFYSPLVSKSDEPSIYDRIINEGKIVLVSPPQGEAKLGKILCAVVKQMFQRSVLSRLERVEQDRLRNYSRPLTLMIDEYSDVASEQKGGEGDVSFFQKARQFGCGGVLACQSHELLLNSGLGEDAGKALQSVLAGCIFMRVSGPETLKFAGELAGKKEVLVVTSGQSTSQGGMQTSQQNDIRAKEKLPEGILSNLLKQGEALFVGTNDGKTPHMQFVRVPP